MSYGQVSTQALICQCTEASVAALTRVRIRSLAYATELSRSKALSRRFTHKDDVHFTPVSRESSTDKSE
jgi:hypothetical protein